MMMYNNKGGPNREAPQRPYEIPPLSPRVS